MSQGRFGEKRENRVERVLNGYFKLSEEERRQFESELQRYKATWDFTEKKRIEERTRDTVFRLDLGPLGENCPCCGR
jgi:5-methylcytosine-specific restriction endonuclease McrA